MSVRARKLPAPTKAHVRAHSHTHGDTGAHTRRDRRQDAGRLVDLCRQSLVVDDVAALRRCLAALAADPEARVLRVKNRFAGPGAAGVGGYRDVMVARTHTRPHTHKRAHTHTHSHTHARTQPARAQ